MKGKAAISLVALLGMSACASKQIHPIVKKEAQVQSPPRPTDALPAPGYVVRKEEPLTEERFFHMYQDLGRHEMKVLIDPTPYQK